MQKGYWWVYIGIGCIWAASSANTANLGAERDATAAIWDLGQSQVSSLAFKIPSVQPCQKFYKYNGQQLYCNIVHRYSNWCCIPALFLLIRNWWEYNLRLNEVYTTLLKILQPCAVQLKIEKLNSIFWWHRSFLRPRYTNSIALAWEQWMADVMQVNTLILLFLYRLQMQ